MKTIFVNVGTYNIGIDSQTGLLNHLANRNTATVLSPHEDPLALGVDLAWEPLEAAPRYLQHTSNEDELIISLSFGPLQLADHYSLTGGLLEREVRISNASEREQQITGFRFGLAGISVGEPEDCRFEAPANVVRPRIPLSLAASQPLSPHASPMQWPYHQQSKEFAPGAGQRYGMAMGDAPDVGPGLMIVHNTALGRSLATWYVSSVEAGRPWVSGDGIRATLGFDTWLAGWLQPGESLTCSTQYILLHEGSYEELLADYQARFSQTGITPPLYGQPDAALDWTALYEVHPGQFGGFSGLKDAIPGLADLHIDTIYLLPIQKHRNKQNLPWDENWESIGSPYAIKDYRSLEPSLGTETDFKAMVETAHVHGIRVLMDFVPQGCALEARYVEEHPEWFARDEQGNMVHSHGWNDTWSFDWANPDYHEFMKSWALDFVRKFDIDGFRIDAPHGKEPNWARDLPYHASKTNLGTVKLLEDLRQELAAIKPSTAMYCELFGPLFIRSHDISNDYHPYAMIMQLFMDGGQLTPYEFNEYLRDYWAVMPPGSPRICFTETHDTRSWPAYALRGSAISQAMLGILVMVGFVPMIWAGQEQGQQDFIRELLRSRKDSRVLRRGKMLFNEVTIDDMGHYRRTYGDRPDEAVYTILRHDDEIALFGVVSLLPEHITYRFGLPVNKLPVDKKALYRLRDLISGEIWDEYGRSTWTGEELTSFRLTPRMYRPYIFQLEAVEE